MNISVAFAVALLAAAVLVVDFALAYPTLPATVPLNFDFAGRPRGYGPRWMLPLLFGSIDIAMLATFFIPSSSRNGPAFVSEVIEASSMVFIAFIQHLIIRVARHQDERLSRSFVPGVIALIAVCVVVAVLGR